MEGIILIDKPAGWSSHDVVAKVRSTLKKVTGQKIKVGHTGTLDPFATGLLVLVVGSYTKRASEFSKLDKAYSACMILGAVSSTGDSEGEITPKSDRRPLQDEIQEALDGFRGEIRQKPHKFSAVKIDGQRAYKLARKGEEVEIEARRVNIKKLEMRGYEYPKLKITTTVSSGTYIRTLAEDIGTKLDIGAYLAELRRTNVGQFDISNAIKMDHMTAEGIRLLKPL